ncbi:hypothetical protein BI096_gp34 [Enterobacter phage Arya]|uniref:Uncharacterized protein n=1 Tax=Enterobacter phage Arya TaxID=1864622 RepID=A0A193GYS9_9CAUD|nr:hypothetical protein BI096_gp34 [Enterobacter phage Arya]ANN86171.1 hypothetical protein BI096_gp34 [Enterobacter phage Arya]
MNVAWRQHDRAIEGVLEATGSIAAGGWFVMAGASRWLFVWI